MLKLQLSDLAAPNVTNLPDVRLQPTELGSVALTTPKSEVEATLATLVTKLADYEAVVQQVRILAVQASEGHQAVLQDTRSAEDENVRLRSELADTQARLALVERRVPRFFRKLFGA